MEKIREKFKFRFLIWAAVALLSVSGTIYSDASIVQAETDGICDAHRFQISCLQMRERHLYADYAFQCVVQRVDALQ